jgi:benzoate-CoA ligase
MHVTRRRKMRRPTSTTLRLVNAADSPVVCIRCLQLESTMPAAAAPPAAYNFAANLFERNAARASKPAYVDDHGTLTYGELERQSRCMAAALRAAGVRRDERVLLAMQDNNLWPVSFLGCLFAGAVPVAVNTLLTADDFNYMLVHSRAQLVLTSSPVLAALHTAMATAPHEVREVWVAHPSGPLAPGQVDLAQRIAATEPLTKAAATAGEEPAFWLYSSGSTGRPKGTVHTHANLYWTAELYGRGVLELTESDVCFSAAKLFFAYGLGNALTFPLWAGAATVLMAERPTPEAVFKRWTGGGGPKPTLFFGAPTGYAGMLVSAALPARSEVALRLCSSAGEALPRELGERFSAHFGCELIDGIGSTEMLHIFLSNRPGDVHYGSTGKPVPGYTIELRGDDGQPVPDGEVGDLYIGGPSAALMYWANRDKSRDTFQGAWTKSGDKYVRNANGTYTYSGRSDDMLKVSGQYVSPFEVEATLVQHAAVLEAAVIGVPDTEGLTRAKAFVVLKPGHHATPTLEDELKTFVKTRLAPFKYPRQIEFMSELPKTSTGKIQRFRLRELEAAKPPR